MTIWKWKERRRKTHVSLNKAEMKRPIFSLGTEKLGNSRGKWFICIMALVDMTCNSGQIEQNAGTTTNIGEGLFTRNCCHVQACHGVIKVKRRHSVGINTADMELLSLSEIGLQARSSASYSSCLPKPDEILSFS